MRMLWCLLLCCTTSTLLAQDDMPLPDNRNKRDNYAKMQEKDIKNDLASFAFAALDDRLGKKPLKGIPAVDYGGNFISFEGENIKVTIRSGPFDPQKHKLGYYGDKHLIKIDGKPYWGSYGTIPQYSISSVTVLIGKDTVAIPAEAYMDLHSPVFTYTDDKGAARTNNGVYFSPDGKNIYIYMLNLEMIGKYEVTWIIQDKKYLRRVVDSGILR